MSPNTLLLTHSDITARSEELVASVGMSLDDLRVRAHDYALSIDELEVLRELERLRFLAG